jgi:hypothetical protein
MVGVNVGSVGGSGVLVGGGAMLGGGFVPQAVSNKAETTSKGRKTSLLFIFSSIRGKQYSRMNYVNIELLTWLGFCAFTSRELFSLSLKQPCLLVISDWVDQFLWSLTKIAEDRRNLEMVGGVM